MDKQDSGITRRDALKLAGGALLGAGVLHLALSSPASAADPFSAGAVADFPVGTVKDFADQNVSVLRDEDGIWALSLVCTHMGGTLDYSDGSYRCKRHGAMFDKQGQLLRPPARAPLPWKAVTITNGQIMVDPGKTVSAGTKVSV